jgi:hypothetical protein
MTTKAQQTEQTEALDKLKDILKAGDTLYTILRNVSSSGMSRVISVVKVEDGDIRILDGLIERAGLYKRTPASSRHDGLKVGGAGMDMGFAVVYRLSGAVLEDGYALKQRWL